MNVEALKRQRRSRRDQAAQKNSWCRRDIRSLRDLKPEHLLLLENILKQGSQVGGALASFYKLICVIIASLQPRIPSTMTSG